MQLSKTDTTSMRGVAITLIVWHNLLHLLIPIKENEFAFDIKYSQLFLEHIKELNPSLWMDFFSFLGWYGVPIFLFVSGYGLVQKYEKNHLDTNFIVFSFYHLKKLFTLMIFPYLVYLSLVFIVKQSINLKSAIFQITMISNLYPPYIDPGIYWFWGVMAQLYICYYLFFYKKHNSYLLYFNVLSMIIMIFILVFVGNSLLFKHVSYISLIRHNFIGWILPFTLGIYCARKHLDIKISSLWKNIFLLIVGIALLILSNLNIYTWLLSPIVAIALAIIFNNILNHYKKLNNYFIMLGEISAFLFAVHPIVRYIYIHTINSSEFVFVTFYFIISIIVAICYKISYNYVWK